jgi:chromosome segregation ATPase
MTSVIMPAGSSSVDLNTLLAVLSSPQSIKDNVAQLKKASDEATASLTKLRLEQVTVDNQRKAAEAAMAARERQLRETKETLDSNVSEYVAKRTSVEVREKALQQRDMDLSARERAVKETEKNHRAREAFLDKRQEEILDKEHSVDKLSTEAAKIKSEYQTRMDQLTTIIRR